ncbi:MAG: CPBP family intramembrane metalloprotease [Oscillospiraceae bacterium]|jgi:membrane protease YdiL (CAAX protease family)|nr:CPBP family intramembrane metalloprotease [Oscillospiraceae bacterium]
MNEHVSLIVPDRRAQIAGWCYLPFFVMGLSLVLWQLATLLGIAPATEEGSVRMTGLFFVMNAVVVCFFFCRFLLASTAPIRGRFVEFLFAILVGFLGLNILSILMQFGLNYLELYPQNLNKAMLQWHLRLDPVPLALCWVLLVPLTHECLLRGAIFAPLCRYKPWLAYLVSVPLSALAQVLPNIRLQTPHHALIAVIQYLPAAIVYACVYHRTRSIWASIFLHAMMNLLIVTLLLLRANTLALGVVI